MKTLTKAQYDFLLRNDNNECAGSCVPGGDGPIQQDYYSINSIGKQLKEGGHLVVERCRSGGVAHHWYITATGKLAKLCYELATRIIQNALTED